MNPFLLTIENLSIAKTIDKNFRQLDYYPLHNWGYTNTNNTKGVQKVFIVSVRTNIPFIQLCHEFPGILRVTKS